MHKNYSYFISGFVILVILLSVLTGVSLLYPFLASILLSLYVFSKTGTNLAPLLRAAWAGVWECKDLYVFILLIGANIAVWMASGVVPALIFYGFNFLKGMNFLLMAFIITGLMSVFMGSAVGTISTLGIALLGIGKGFGIPAPVLLGTLVSGAYIADKISPISGLVNLSLKVTKTSYRQVVKRMAATFLPVFFSTATAYWVMGRFYSGGEDLALIESFQGSLQQSFDLSPLLLLLPLGVVLLPLTGVGTTTSVLGGMLGGALLTIFYQGNSLADTLTIVLRGYQAKTPSPQLNGILVSGGAAGMLEVVLIVVAVIALGSLLEGSRILKPLIYDPIIKVRERGELILKTGIISSLLTIITCDQATGIVLPARMYRAKYEELGLDKTILARTISDTGTVIAPLLPWNVNGIIIGTLTGISALEYGPFAILCYLFPLTTLSIFVFSRAAKKDSPKNRAQGPVN